MGAGMVRNLAAAGHEVVVFARTPARAEGLPARLAGTVAEAVDGAEVACTCVTDSPDSVAVVAAMLAAGRPPPVVCDFATIAPATAGDLAARCADRGVAYLDCPVSGGPPGAAAGTLAVMVGGEAGALERARPVLDAVGDPAKRVHCGPSGAGLVAKLVNNLLVAVISAGTAEAMGMGQRAGVDPEVLRRVLLASSGASWQLEHLFPRVLAGDHRPGFRARDLRKDLGHAQDLAGGPLPLGDVAAGLFRAVDGALDYGAVARRFMDLPEPPAA
jgi:3-hydroxyisobutyrate dehydrogenase-like beta-hydroxyacid dehydrogenase